jgi:hypothetical protein
VALLHGATGGWDELLMLLGGIALAVFVVKWTQRSAAQSDESEELDELARADAEGDQAERR